MKNILVGVDLNEKTDVLIEKAQNLALKYGAKLWLLHVTSPLPEYVGFDVTPHYSTEGSETIKETQRKRLAKFVDELKKQGLDADAIVMDGVPTATIIDESKELNVDLIICGHHEHSVFYNMLFGSTSASIVRNSEIPVLVYPLKEK